MNLFFVEDVWRNEKYYKLIVELMIQEYAWQNWYIEFEVKSLLESR